MTDRSSKSVRITIGLDLGDRYSRLCALGRGLEVVAEERVPTTPGGLRKVFNEFASSVVAIEAGTHSGWVSRLLEQCGHSVLVANPRQVALIPGNKKKSDKVDAELLARLARLDPSLLSPIKHRGLEAQVDLSLIRSRDCLVGTRTALINHVRSTVKSFGGRLPRCDGRNFHRKVTEWIPKELGNSLAPVLKIVAELTATIEEFDKQIEELSKKKYPETRHLRQVTGVGWLTALAFVLTLEDPSRFEKSRLVGAFLGLVPRQSDSGDRSPQLRITKAGDVLLRRLLVSAAHYILGPFGENCDLRRHGEAIARRGGKNAKKRAVVAVARKLSVLLHRLWATGDVYGPLYSSSRKDRILTASSR